MHGIVRVPNHIPLSGAENVRDLGGFAAADGGRTRRFAFLRGESPHRMSDLDVVVLIKLGVRDVIDLRNDEEATREPSPLRDVPVMRVHHIPLLDGAATPHAVGGADMGDLYVHMLENSQQRLLQVFRAMLGSQGGVFFHCVAGKDRTGLVAALLLLLAGVDRKLVVGEYCHTQTLMGAWRLREGARIAAAEPDFDARALDARPAYLNKALDHLQRHFIDAEGYLRAIGLRPGELDALRGRLVEHREQTAHISA